MLLQYNYIANSIECCYFGLRTVVLDSPEKVDCFKNAILTSKFYFLNTRLFILKSFLNCFIIIFLANAADFAYYATKFWVGATRGAGDPDGTWCNSRRSLVDSSLWKGGVAPINAMYPCSQYCTYAAVTATGFELMEAWCDTVPNQVICEYPN
jgi:hypothetical protein